MTAGQASSGQGAVAAYADLIKDLLFEVGASGTGPSDGAFRQARFENYNVYSVPYRMAEIFDVLCTYAGLDDLSGLEVVDCGCGNGGTTLFMATEGRAKRVVGLDISGENLGVAARVVRRNQLRHVRFVRADLGRLPLAAGSTDVSLLYDSLVYRAIDLEMALAEQHRILRAGGHTVIKVANRWSPLMLPLSLRGVRTIATPVLNRVATSGDRMFLSDAMEVPSARDVKRLLNRCGFTDVRVYDRYRRSDRGWYRYFAPDVIVAAAKGG